jgi:hypothetical protein
MPGVSNRPKKTEGPFPGLPVVISLLLIIACGRDGNAADAKTPTKPESPSESPEAPDKTSATVFADTRVVFFEWRPTTGFHGSYSLSEQADQHRIVIPAGIQKGKSYPVVIGFHGQPRRGKDPRDYMFMAPVQRTVLRLVESGDIEPVILVMPVFRFLGTNWPKFNPRLFQKKVMELLAKEGIEAREWYAFGHSGAAGCGGDGLNQIHGISPDGVGFFDTCLGKNWQQEVKQLQKAGVKTFNIHSVETAGFKPKQRPEYQANFDFGRAYAPLGIEPVPCPKVHPGARLRKLPYRCSATSDGLIQSFVVDTGEGEAAHKAILEPAITYFLKYFLAVK